MAEQRTVLVVDDNEGMRRLNREHLKGVENCRLLEASDGMEAWNLLQREKVDIVVSDIAMPNLDGMGLLKKIRESPDLADLYLIFVTANTRMQDKTEGLQRGADDYLGKPIVKQELLARVEVGFRTVAFKQLLKRANQEMSQINALKNDFLRVIIDYFGSALMQMEGTLEVLQDDNLGPLAPGHRELLRVFAEKITGMKTIAVSFEELKDCETSQMAWNLSELPISLFAEGARAGYGPPTPVRPVLEIVSRDGGGRILAEERPVAHLVARILEVAAAGSHPRGKIVLETAPAALTIRFSHQVGEVAPEDFSASSPSGDQENLEVRKLLARSLAKKLLVMNQGDATWETGDDGTERVTLKFPPAAAVLAGSLPGPGKSA